MPKFETLYYPYFEPPKGWFRSFLLFYDTINTIVPKDAGFEPSDYILELLYSTPDAFRTIRPTNDDIIINDINLDRLRKAFKVITEQSFDKNQIKITLRDGGRISILGHTFLHDNKMSHEVRSLLQEYNLINTELKRLANDGYTVVNEVAGNLIVSHLADKVSKRLALDTITDQQIHYTFNILNDFKFVNNYESNDMLISSIIKCEIPQNIENISYSKFKEIRDAYSELREPFQKVICDLNNTYHLDRIENMEILKQKIYEITQDFNREVEKLKKTKWASTIERWTPIAFGGIAGITGAVLSQDIRVAITCASVPVIIEFIKEIKNKNNNYESDKTKLQKLIGGLQNDILKASGIRKLI